MRQIAQHELDGFWMGRAIDLARQGADAGEWPFGAVVVRPDPYNPTRGVEVSSAHSTERVTGNPAGHAELHAVERAGFKYGRLLRGCTLYTTHEPCLMCSGLVLQAKLSRLVVGSMRADRPDLFRQRRLGLLDVVRDANPAYPLAVSAAPVDAHRRCMQLFDGLVDDAPSAAA